jgi:hypothetical protein
MKKLILSIFFIASLKAFSQEKDFGVWSSAELGYEVIDDLDVSVSPELRWDQNVTRLRNRQIDFKAKYKLPSDIFFVAAYRVGGIQRNSGWQERKRIQMGGGVKYKMNDFVGTFTTRFQRAVSERTRTRDADLNTNWRNKFAITYKGIKKFDVGVSYEFFHGTQEGEFLDWQDWRFVIEGEYKINKRNYISAGFLVQNEFQIGVDQRDRVLFFGYRHEIKRPSKKDKQK